jgi:DNA-directed RNA polymerase sigma subunit (sigma70/sigma32)
MLTDTEAAAYTSRLQELLATKLASKVNERDYNIMVDRIVHGVAINQLAKEHGITGPRIHQIEARVLRLAKRILK